jgi:hypothetical protein
MALVARQSYVEQPDGCATSREPTGRDAATRSPADRCGGGSLKGAAVLATVVPFGVLTLPFLGFLALGPAASFRMWPLFTQQRLGRDSCAHRHSSPTRAAPKIEGAAAELHRRST